MKEIYDNIFDLIIIVILGVCLITSFNQKRQLRFENERLQLKNDHLQDEINTLYFRMDVRSWQKSIDSLQMLELKTQIKILKTENQIKFYEQKRN